MQLSTAYLMYDKSEKSIPLVHEMVLGRGMAEDNDQSHLFFPEPTVSKIHAILQKKNTGSWYLCNKSKNGTLVNAQIITGQVCLFHGDRIFIDKHTLTFCDSIGDTSEVPVSSVSSFSSSSSPDSPDREPLVFFVSFGLVALLLWFLIQIFA